MHNTNCTLCILYNTEKGDTLYVVPIDQPRKEVHMIITDKQMQTISSYMKDDIREDLHAELAPCDHETFLKEYLKRDH